MALIAELSDSILDAIDYAIDVRSVPKPADAIEVLEEVQEGIRARIAGLKEDMQ